METNVELLDTQNNQDGEVTPLSTEELKRRAEVSSQNFERAKKAELEVKELRAKLLEKQNIPVEIPEEAMSDEGKLLKDKISHLEKTLGSFQENQALGNVYSQFPAIKDKQSEFNEFRSEYPGMSLERIAKIFMFENGLVDSQPKRLGLEKPTGGAKAPVKQGQSIEDIHRLRTSQPKLYQKMLKTGQINPDNIE